MTPYGWTNLLPTALDWMVYLACGLTALLAIGLGTVAVTVVADRVRGIYRTRRDQHAAITAAHREARDYGRRYGPQ